MSGDLTPEPAPDLHGLFTAADQARYAEQQKTEAAQYQRAKRMMGWLGGVLSAFVILMTLLFVLGVVALIRMRPHHAAPAALPSQAFRR